MIIGENACVLNNEVAQLEIRKELARNKVKNARDFKRLLFKWKGMEQVPEQIAVEKITLQLSPDTKALFYSYYKQFKLSFELKRKEDAVPFAPVTLTMNFLRKVSNDAIELVKSQTTTSTPANAENAKNTSV